MDGLCAELHAARKSHMGGSSISGASYSEFAEAGGLISYGPDRLEGYRRAALFVDKLLQGAKPGDLPIHQPTLFEWVINARTAGTLDLKIGRAVLFRADRVIE